MNICFIGYGNMAKAMAKGLAQSREISIHACAPSLSDGIQDDGVYTHANNNSVIAMMDVIILAVKPQQIKSVLPKLNLPQSCLLLSIAAGVSLEQLSNLLPKNQAIVRCMPNLPLEVGYGATQMIANAFCTTKHKKNAQAIFADSGIFIWLNDEALIDAYTALSGSGPAYIFYFLEAMIEGAKQLGINESNAKQYAEQTMLGALKLSQATSLPLEKLRSQITSPAGTTAEAIQILEQRHLKKIIAEAMAACNAKAKQLKESIK